MTVAKYIWGKARYVKLNNQRTLIHHPLICHLIDVAAVAEAFWKAVLSSYTKEMLGAFFNGNQDLAKKLIIFLSGIHDIGKATPPFQAQIEELAETLKKFGLNLFKENRYHSILSGELFFKTIINNKFNFPIKDPEFNYNIKYVLGGHHGVYPQPRDFTDINDHHLGNNLWNNAQIEMLNKIAKFSNLSDKLSFDNLDQKLLNPILTFISGFISVVDWIGSNEKFFPFFTDFDNLDDLEAKYFPLSRKRAKDAIRQIGWGEWREAQENQKPYSFKEVFPKIEAPRPLQSTILENITQIEAPSLVIIEAPMGEGKTEAAFYLEHYLEKSQKMQGAFIALPTQATANQMFTRTKTFLQQTKRGNRTNLHLLHGNALLSDEYTQLKSRPSNSQLDDDSIVADEWFSFRKRGLISPFGVGTVDQIMLSVLPLKHFFVRLFGLTGKIIIIDEVHSYDVYMSTILEELLKWLRYLGSTVILLSATLPSKKRKLLIEAFQSEEHSIQEKPYPRITICSENKVTQSLSFDTALKKCGNDSILLNWIKEGAILDYLTDNLDQGGRVAIICNTVRRAQNLYQCLKSLEDRNINLHLLHSRFPFKWRDNIEKKILKIFGKNQNHTSNHDILVSTQIIEQSLDLDFDLMISDLAPIDLIFQRLGRLHRHVYDDNGYKVIRPEKLKRPEFLIMKPKLDENGIPKIRYSIYSKYVMLKTYLILQTVNSISIPDDIEPNIEKVYTQTDYVPQKFEENKHTWIQALSNAKEKQEKKKKDKIIMARYKIIPNPKEDRYFREFSEYLTENTPDAKSFFSDLTRITTPSINLICLYDHETYYSLDEEGKHMIELSERPSQELTKLMLNYGIRVSSYPIFKYFSEQSGTIPSSWKQNSLLRHYHYVSLIKEKNTKRYYFKIPDYKVYLDKELGMITERIR